MTALIVVDPAQARREIRNAMTRAGGVRDRAAELMGCGRATFHRWVVRLGMAEDLDRIEAKAKREKWYGGGVGQGWPKGRPRKTA